MTSWRTCRHPLRHPLRQTRMPAPLLHVSPLRWPRARRTSCLHEVKLPLLETDAAVPRHAYMGAALVGQSTIEYVNIEGMAKLRKCHQCIDDQEDRFLETHIAPRLADMPE